MKNVTRIVSGSVMISLTLASALGFFPSAANACAEMDPNCGPMPVEQPAPFTSVNVSVGSSRLVVNETSLEMLSNGGNLNLTSDQNVLQPGSKLSGFVNTYSEDNGSQDRLNTDFSLLYSVE
jgi:hypothetical protein